jgi:hypothetical protein
MDEFILNYKFTPSVKLPPKKEIELKPEPELKPESESEIKPEPELKPKQKLMSNRYFKKK